VEIPEYRLGMPVVTGAGWEVADIGALPVLLAGCFHIGSGAALQTTYESLVYPKDRLPLGQTVVLERPPLLKRSPHDIWNWNAAVINLAE
jgi:hypothetical protein